MIKVEKIEVTGWKAAIQGMRNPLQSWHKSDSYDIGFEKDDGERFISNRFRIGKNDLDLMQRLVKAGSDHAKFMRFINVTMDITAPTYFLLQFDTYKIGTVSNSSSKMHRLLAKPFEINDFSHEHLLGCKKTEYFDVDLDIEEDWKDIDKNYKISNKGNVLSVRKNKMLSLCVNSSNYKKIRINKKNYYVHRLVAEYFVPNPNNFEEVNHIDGNKWNNNFTNLEWVSKSGNAKHAFDMGLRNISGYTKYKVSHTSRRFSVDEVATIKSLYHDGLSKKEIAKEMNCYDSIICDILNGKRYREIELTPFDLFKITIDNLNLLRDKYLETQDKRYWNAIIQLLPESYNQIRTVQLNYEVLHRMYLARKDHKLDEWREFCNIMIEHLPHFAEIIGIQND